MASILLKQKQKKIKRIKNTIDENKQNQLLFSNLKDQNLFPCQHCPYSFETNAGLDIHVSMAHDSEWKQYVEKVNDKYNCKLCNTSFTKNIGVRVHIACVHKIGSNLRCLECPKVCFYQQQLEQHRLVHSEERKFVCDECGMKLKSVTHVKVHKNKIHISEEDKLRLLYMFSCTVCEKKYSNKASLAVHVQSHGDRTISCKDCDKKFKRKDVLRVHIKRNHLGLKAKCLTEEELEKKRACVRLSHVKRRLKLKEANGGVLRKGEERIKFNNYKKNWSAKRRNQQKQKVPKI